MASQTSKSTGADNLSDDSAQLDLSYSSSDFEDSEQPRNDGQIVPYQFEPYDSDRSVDLTEDDGVMDEGRLLTTEWCTCQVCTISTKAVECVCCQEIDRVTELMAETEGQQPRCITDHPGFEPVCLNTYVLQTAYLQYRQQYGGEITESNEKYRYTAYRQFVRWIWGYLGKKIRVVIPSCAVKKIRSNFPSEDGNYVGFNPPQ